MLSHWFGKDAKRQRLLAKVTEGALHQYLSHSLPDSKAKIIDTPMLAVDFETTGLDVNKDQILSIGYVKIDALEIKLSTCGHYVVNTIGDLAADNVVIHQITDQEKCDGIRLDEAIALLLKALEGRAMLVHFNRIESQFFAKACTQLYGYAPPVTFIDTLLIAKRRLDKRSVSYDPSELRLMNLRERYGLPMHYAHNALNDAIATAELLFAQLNEIDDGEQQALKFFEV